jgi:hypothetical protein
MSLSGTCLCGAVRYEASAEAVFSGHCYCKDCQKEAGAGHLTVVAVPDASVKITGPLNTYTKLSASGQPTERTFCSTCGSTLFSRPRTIAGTTLLRVGTLDDPSQIAPSMSVYASRAHSWDPPSESIPKFPEMPPHP